MGEIVTRIENVSKLYRLGEVGTGTLAHDLNRWWAGIRGKDDPFSKVGEVNDTAQAGGDYVWALRDVNLEVGRGDVLGIIGRNGAGKSTLLKLLSRVTGPTKGKICIKGRTASLLEVGTGFHPELTGRENVFLNGTILGMRAKEVRSRFDEIVEFSGCAKYIDTPVKRYSSGMYVRLAFAVAAHLEPDILIVDEVLAVGDAEFQSKCIGKMQDVSRKQGRTVLFVSHNMGSVKRLCSRSLLLDRGRVAFEGETPDVIERYLSVGGEFERYVEFHDRSSLNGDISVKSVGILDSNRKQDSLLTTIDDIFIEVDYELKSPIKDLRVAVNLLSFDGTLILATSDFGFQESSRVRQPGCYRSTCRIPSKLLNAGKYVASVDLDVPLVKAYFKGLNIGFSVSLSMYNQLGLTYGGKPPGLIHPFIDWVVRRVD